MGIFTKETRTVFHRNEAGEVAEVEHIGNARINAERKTRWEKAKEAWHESQAERAAQRKVEREAYKQSYQKARVESAHRRGASAGKQGGMYMPRVSYYAPPPQKKRKTGGNFYWTDPMTFGLTRVKKKKKVHQRYAVVGGKAYPVAGKGGHYKVKPKKYVDPVQVYMRRIGL